MNALVIVVAGVPIWMRVSRWVVSAAAMRGDNRACEENHDVPCDLQINLRSASA